MESQSTTIKVDDQILGYKLVRKIGSGGYGDVWEADAPGGLKKAIKVVFGYHDERRAQSEMKALDRIKNARHPFLLSLERIEIFNSQLVVVSELADKSLSDLSNEYRIKSGQGIPRDELIGYMKETADALDYLNNEFQLQHLDIKPENILLVSGHAKVADFGLVKEITSHTQQSLMSGMTPAYAAPELFDGQPGPASDQYSLAVVYQEMLTTLRPFNGTTTAQLAVQHMHGKPDLHPLPVGDQAVVATALSKDPVNRYEDCRTFVEKLVNRKSRRKAVKSRVTIRETTDTGCNTVVVNSSELESTQLRTDVVSAPGLNFKKSDLQTIDPPDCDPDAAVFQPTIVVAIGESSSRVVQKLKQRLVDRFDTMEALPSLSFLCIDADNDSLAMLSHMPDGCSLGISETLSVPLRRPERYRSINNLDLSWLSRRWIYNVPRNLKINGLRPLGRLVFADHFEKICNRISDCIKSSSQPENVAKCCETLELNPPENIQPNVILVSNISGGIGSGMTNDMAYTIRLMLAENGFGEGQLTGMLMHGVKAGREVSLAAANSYAYLCELRHFTDRGYPGDPRLGIPEYDEELPFDHTYGLRLNVSCDETKSNDLDRIADYLFLSTATKCSSFIVATRAREEDSEEFALRTFGMGVCGPGHENSGSEFVEKVSKGVIDYWVNGPIEDFDASQFVIQIAQQLQLDASFATAKVTQTILDTPEWKDVKFVIEKAPKLYQAGAFKNVADVKACFDEIYGARIMDRECSSESTEFNYVVEPEIAEIGHALGEKMCAAVLEMVNSSEVSFAKVNVALDACFQFTDCQLAELSKSVSGIQKQLAEIEAQVAGFLDNQHDDVQIHVEMAISQYAKLRFKYFAAQNSHYLFRVVKARLSSTKEIVKKIKLQTQFIGQQFEVPQETTRVSRSKVDVQSILMGRIVERHQEMVKLAQKMVVDEITSDENSPGGFLGLMDNGVAWQKTVPETIRNVARSVLWREFSRLDVDEILQANRVSESDTKRWLNKLLNASLPFVSDCGGAAALMFACPRHAQSTNLTEFIDENFDIPGTGIAATSGNVAICFEGEGILLANFAFSILKDAPEATELARRIYSRDDIKWTTMEDLM